MDTNELVRMLPLLAPLGLIELVLLIAGFLDLAKTERRTRGPKWVWAIVMFVSFIGPVIYFLAGREEV